MVRKLMDKAEQTINNNTPITMGLAIALVTAVFWGGYKLGTLEQRMDAHEILDMHKGAKELFVPRTEVELILSVMQSDIKDIKDSLK